MIIYPQMNANKRKREDFIGVHSCSFAVHVLKKEPFTKFDSNAKMRATQGKLEQIPNPRVRSHELV
jgi:hypothetical protein